MLYHVFIKHSIPYNDRHQKITVDSLAKFESFALTDPSFVVDFFIGLFPGKTRKHVLAHDHCMVILMWLHYVEVANMIRDSERENDPELFRTGATLAMLLFAKTNATKYIRIESKVLLK